MSALELFQKQHGAEWAGVVRSPAFTAALLLVNAETVQTVALLTDEQIETRGKIILADLRGRLQHENDLINLSVIQPELTNDLPQSTYPDPEDEAEEEAEGIGVSMQGWTYPINKPDPPPSKAVVLAPEKKRKRKAKRKTK